MFYSAGDRETALTEVLEPGDEVASVGRFETDTSVWVVDLDRLPPVPSLFDDDRRHLRAPLRFLHGFSHDFVKPIERNGREHIEYVPTQIVTEYFRHHFRVREGDDIHGIAYTSARRAGGRCVLLFADGDQCYGSGETPRSKARPGLELVSAEHIKPLAQPAVGQSVIPAERAAGSKRG
jgi:hypothetical protein